MPSSIAAPTGRRPYTSRLSSRTDAGFSPSPTMVSVSIPITRRTFLASLSVFTVAMNTQEPGSGWPFAGESWIGTTGGSGSNPNPDKDQLSGLRSPSDSTSSRVPYFVLIVEDNESDVFLVREAMEAARLPCRLHVVEDGEQAVLFFDRADDEPEMPCPALMILDINLPRKQGGDVLRQIGRAHV